MMISNPHRSKSERSLGAIGAGFSNPILGAQATFRAIMSAMAEPGRVFDVATEVGRCPGWSTALTAVTLTLADFETRVWLEPEADVGAGAYLRFHTGTRIVTAHAEATFACLVEPRSMPALAMFAAGTLEYPDTSTTLLIDVEALIEGDGLWLSGPGIARTRRLHVDPLPADFLAQIADNRAQFPCGVDLVFCCGYKIAALPRSTRVSLTGEA